MSAGSQDHAPEASVLASSAVLRVAVALALSAALWLGVVWASAG